MKVPIETHTDASANVLTPSEMAGLRHAFTKADMPMKKAIAGKMNTVIIKNSVGRVSADTINEITAILMAFLLLMGGLMIGSANANAN